VIRVAVAGALGKMGQQVRQVLGEHADEMRLVGALEHKQHAQLGQLLDGELEITADPRVALENADVYIDFTSPAATVELVQVAAQKGVAAVVGTTGLSPVDRIVLAKAAEQIPLVWAPNFSIGVNVLLALVEHARRAIGPDWDVEVVDLHHKMKRDAPSGTAMALGERAVKVLGLKLEDVQRLARAGDVGARPKDELGLLAVRGGDVVGEHIVYMFGSGERLELIHRATDRIIFARGAVRAARWVAGEKPGLYSVQDVIGLAGT